MYLLIHYANTLLGLISLIDVSSPLTIFILYFCYLIYFICLDSFGEDKYDEEKDKEG